MAARPRLPSVPDMSITLWIVRGLLAAVGLALIMAGAVDIVLLAAATFVAWGRSGPDAS